MSTSTIVLNEDKTFPGDLSIESADGLFRATFRSNEDATISTEKIDGYLEVFSTYYKKYKETVAGS